MYLKAFIHACLQSVEENDSLSAEEIGRSRDPANRALLDRVSGNLSQDIQES